MITNLIDFFVASKRITEFLHQKEVGGLRSVRATTGETTGEVRVTMKNSAFGWHHGVSEEKEEKEEKEGKEGREGKKQEDIEVVAEMNEATNNTAFALHGINLHLQNEELILVVGRVGSGKSSLLSAMLGEMEQTEAEGTTGGTEGGGTTGTTTLSGSVAYVPQSSWILNATLKENGTAHYLSILCRYSQTQAVAVLTVLLF
jgi:ABC-type multidrug transport system fused ATPase/permease subunit